MRTAKVHPRIFGSDKIVRTYVPCPPIHVRWDEIHVNRIACVAINRMATRTFRGKHDNKAELFFD